MMVLPGWHGGEVLFLVAVVLQPRVVHVSTYTACGIVDGIVDILKSYTIRLFGCVALALCKISFSFQ